MGIGIMGVAETMWNNEGSFATELPEICGRRQIKSIFLRRRKEQERSRYDCKGRGGKVSNDVWADLRQNYDNEIKGGSDKCTVGADIAPNEDADEEVKDRFYGRLDQVIKDYKKGNSA